MHNFCMTALMFLTGHGKKARTHAHAEVAHLPTRCIIRAWEARGLRLSAFQVLMMHQVGKKCVISTWSWVLALFFYNVEWCIPLAMDTKLCHLQVSPVTEVQDKSDGFQVIHVTKRIVGIYHKHGSYFTSILKARNT